MKVHSFCLTACSTPLCIRWCHDVTMCPKQDHGGSYVQTPFPEKQQGTKVSCARQQRMGDNATLIIFLGFAIYLMSLFPTTYCSAPVKIQTTTPIANNEQEYESSPTAGERMG